MEDYARKDRKNCRFIEENLENDPIIVLTINFANELAKSGLLKREALLICLGQLTEKWKVERLCNAYRSYGPTADAFCSDMELAQQAAILLHHIITNPTEACVFQECTTGKLNDFEFITDLDAYKNKLRGSVTMHRECDANWFRNRSARQIVTKIIPETEGEASTQSQQQVIINAHIHSNHTVIPHSDDCMKELKDKLGANIQPNGQLKHTQVQEEINEIFVKKGTFRGNVLCLYDTSIRGVPLPPQKKHSMIRDVYCSRRLAVARVGDFLVVFETTANFGNNSAAMEFFKKTFHKIYPFDLHICTRKEGYSIWNCADSGFTAWPKSRFEHSKLIALQGRLVMSSVENFNFTEQRRTTALKGNTTGERNIVTIDLTE